MSHLQTGIEHALKLHSGGRMPDPDLVSLLLALSDSHYSAASAATSPAAPAPGPTAASDAVDYVAFKCGFLEAAHGKDLSRPALSILMHQGPRKLRLTLSPERAKELGLLCLRYSRRHQPQGAEQ